MAQFLYKIGSTAYRKKWPFLAFWLVVLVAVGSLAALYSKPTTNSMTIPGLESVETMDKMQERFPDTGDALNAPTGTILVQTTDGSKLSDPQVQERVDQMIADLKDTGALTGTDSLVDPVTASMGLTQQMTQAKAAQGIPQEQIDADIKAVTPLSEDQTTGTMSITFDADSATDVPAGELDAVKDVISEYDTDGLKVVANGNAFTAVSEMEMTSEAIGLLVAAVVLLITFGSFVAAAVSAIAVRNGMLMMLSAVSAMRTVSPAKTTAEPAVPTAMPIAWARCSRFMFRSASRSCLGSMSAAPADLTSSLRKRLTMNSA